MKKIKNFISYLWFVMSLDYFQLFSTVVDIIILLFAIVNYKEIISQPTLFLIFLGFLVNFIWQCFNVASHFKFLKKEEPSAPLVSLLDNKKGKKDFSRVNIAKDLTEQEFAYTLDGENGVLRNCSVDAILLSDKPIVPRMGRKKHADTIAYIKQYKETLLKFLNHKWYEVNFKGGDFTNDAKLCLACELFKDNENEYRWTLCKGNYYCGYLTNFIFCKYIAGEHYALYPPMNAANSAIKTLSNSDFSDHIGVSTLLYSSDGYVVVFRQAGYSGYNGGMLVPSGSGSMDYADYQEDKDFRDVVVRAAERELFQESSLEKVLSHGDWEGQISTKVLSFYRDIERGGKPEFCCVSTIDKGKEYLAEYIVPNNKELSGLKPEFVRVSDELSWQNIFSEASLSLKMNYFALKQWLEKSNGNGDFPTNN